MIEIVPGSALPINEQIKSGLRGLVARGLLKPGDQAPSVRGLAASLKVNPNTVARAFRELTAEGVLEPRRGDGNYIAKQAERRAQDGLQSARDNFAESLRHARRAGLGWDELQKTLARERQEDK